MVWYGMVSYGGFNDLFARTLYTKHWVAPHSPVLQLEDKHRILLVNTAEWVSGINLKRDSVGNKPKERQCRE